MKAGKAAFLMRLSRNLSKKWRCHFFEVFPRFTAKRLCLFADVCSGKDGITVKTN
jgi:hypothetical protein